MPNILFASNTVSHFPGAYIQTAAGYYDANRVPYAIGSYQLTPIGSPPILESTTDEYWFHMRCAAENWYPNTVDRVIEVLDVDGNRILYLSYRDNPTYGFTLNVQVDGGNASNVQWYPWPDHQVRTIDVQLKYNALDVEARFYMNEILVCELSYAITTFVHPYSLLLGGHTGWSSEGDFWFSELIVADGDTRNARLDLLRPTAVGAYGNWNGAVATLSDDDPTTGMTTQTAAQSQSTILTAYTGALNISNVFQVTTSVRGINSPTQLQHLIRLSGVDYLTSNFAVPFAKDYQMTDWPQNPATTAPWVAADLANAEFGFKSIA